MTNEMTIGWMIEGLDADSVTMFIVYYKSCITMMVKIVMTLMCTLHDLW